MDKLKVGVIGCGNVSDVYLQNCRKWPAIDVVACSDLISEYANEKAKLYDIPKASSNINDIFNDSSIDLVLNLTNPLAHAEICIAALEAGKHVYTEKPLATNLNDAKKIIDLGKQKGLMVGCAPDTFLGGRLQTCRKLIDDGWIGEPVAATAFFALHGHEFWHPNPDFYYQEGAGPMLDNGVYYMQALVSLLGPVDRVVGNSKRYFTERTITSQAKYGQKIIVGTDTHITGVMDFKNNVTATVLMSFDIWDAQLPRMEIYGKEGTIYTPDEDPYGGPNIFGGKVKIRRGKDSDWLGYPSQIPIRKEKGSPLDEIPLLFGYNENSRGVGLADMVYAIQSGRKNRASADMAYHVLETMLGFSESSKTGKYYKLKSTCERPEPLKMNLPEYVFDQ